MAGRTRIIRPTDPRAGDTPPRVSVQCLDVAGQGRFPALIFETRAANRLLKGKEARVFSVALDGMWRALMSKVQTAGNPNRVSGSELWYRNHCNPTLEPFAPSTRNIGNSRPIGSVSGEREPGQATGRGVPSRSHANTWRSNKPGARLNQSAEVGRGEQFDAGLSGNGQTTKLHGFVEIERTSEDSGLCGAVEYRSPGYTFPNKQILSRCDGGR